MTLDPDPQSIALCNGLVNYLCVCKCVCVLYSLTEKMSQNNTTVPLCISRKLHYSYS